MTAFFGTAADDAADASAGTITGFTGGTISHLQDTEGDTFAAGSGNDRVFAGAGDDFIDGGNGDDILDGMGGNDRLRGGLGADTLVGGAGVDIAAYDDDFGAVFVNLTLGSGFGNAAQGDTLTGIENLVGSQFGDTFIGDAGVNTLDGGGGDDVLRGAMGADILIGGTGVDTASYEDNQGAVFVNLALRRGSNNAAEGDTYTGIENVFGSIYDDFLIGDDGANILSGGDGNDVLIGGRGADRLDGGEGSDTASYEDNQSAVVVSLGSSTRSGVSAVGDIFISIENLTGSAFGDTLTGDAGINEINGLDGSDFIDGGAGADRLFGGAGIDTLVYATNSTGVSVNLQTNVVGGGGDAAGDTISGFERVYGSTFADTIIGALGAEGNGGNDIIVGTAGDDTLNGNDGDDVLAGGAGSDNLIGGAGVDTITYLADLQGPVTVNLVVGRGSANASFQDQFVSIENVTGTIYDDFIVGNADINVLRGEDGDDVLLGYLGADTLNGGSGLDTAHYGNLTVSVSVNLATGQVLEGGSVGDTLISIENVFGSNAADTLVGDGGDNVLAGLMGADRLTGGGGVDSFAFGEAEYGEGVDTITDFTPGTDILRLNATNPVSPPFALFRQLQVGSLSPSAFVVGTAATTAEHRLVYDPQTGNLSYDRDGSGSDAAVHFAVLENKPTITSADFLIV